MSTRYSILTLDVRFYICHAIEIIIIISDSINPMLDIDRPPHVIATTIYLSTASLIQLPAHFIELGHTIFIIYSFPIYLVVLNQWRYLHTSN